MKQRKSIRHSEAYHDLENFFSISEEKLNGFIENISSANPKDILSTNFMRRTAQKIDVDSIMLLRGFSAIISIYCNTFDGDSSYEETIIDLVEEDIEKNKKDRIIKFIKSNINTFENIYNYISENIETYCAIRKFKDINTSIITMTEFKKEFKLKMSTSDYKPVIKNKHPFVLIEFETLGDDPTEFNFRVRENNLDDIIKHLQFAKIQLNTVKISNNVNKK